MEAALKTDIGALKGIIEVALPKLSLPPLPAAKMRLIYADSVLKDATTLASIGFDSLIHFVGMSEAYLGMSESTAAEIKAPTGAPRR